MLNKQLLTFIQANFDNPMKGTRAIIENATPKPLKVIFENQALQHAIINTHRKFYQARQKSVYIVDVDIQTIGGQPKVYKILNYYEDEILNPKKS